MKYDPEGPVEKIEFKGLLDALHNIEKGMCSCMHVIGQHSARPDDDVFYSCTKS